MKGQLMKIDMELGLQIQKEVEDLIHTMIQSENQEKITGQIIKIEIENLVQPWRLSLRGDKLKTLIMKTT